MNRLFITGIGTGVGKTIVSAVVSEALQADYWKPIQTGSLQDNDSDTVRRLLTNSKSVVHPEAYRLRKPVSPHEAAAAEGVRIGIRSIKPPETSNLLVIEGAGGLLVPLNEQETMLHLIRILRAKVILVVRHYLGSINHTLLSAKALQAANARVAGIIYSGTANPASEEAIRNFSGYPVLGRLKEYKVFTPAVVSGCANEIRPALLSLTHNPHP